MSLRKNYISWWIERLTLPWTFCWASLPSNMSSPPSPEATFLWRWAFCSLKATICRTAKSLQIRPKTDTMWEMLHTCRKFCAIKQRSGFSLSLIFGSLYLYCGFATQTELAFLLCNTSKLQSVHLCTNLWNTVLTNTMLEALVHLYDHYNHHIPLPWCLFSSPNSTVLKS